MVSAIKAACAAMALEERKGWNRSRDKAREWEELKFEICRVKRAAEAVLLRGIELRL
jgi:hypothetical protein